MEKDHYDIYEISKFLRNQSKVKTLDSPVPRAPQFLPCYNP